MKSSPETKFPHKDCYRHRPKKAYWLVFGEITFVWFTFFYLESERGLFLLILFERGGSCIQKDFKFSSEGGGGGILVRNIMPLFYNILITLMSVY